MAQKINLVILSLLLSLTLTRVTAQLSPFHVIPDYPGEHWYQYVTPEEAGWSSGKLAEARKYFNETGGAAAMAVFNGHILVSWGDVQRRYMCHSMRKSIFSALCGVYVESGDIDISKTLAEINIDDIPPLTEAEKQAKVEDLLKARSGVYHAAAYETKSMTDSKPPRGSYAPGTYWHYNNWDFNTLVTIFNQQTGRDFFEEFDKLIAKPLQMEDFRITDTYYHYEPSSIHPAYPFRLSARDLARFGLLILNSGKWKKEQIIPSGWIEQSTQPYSETGSGRGGYGYMWWISGDEELANAGMFSAAGAGGHKVDILPGENLVFVFRVNTYKDSSVSNNQSQELLKKILDARISDPESNPELVTFDPEQKRRIDYDLPENKLDEYANYYKFPDDFDFDITTEKGKLYLNSPSFGTFLLIPVADNEFLLEDAEYRLIFKPGEDGILSGVIFYTSDDDFEVGTMER